MHDEDRTGPPVGRHALMSVCAHATEAELEAALAAVGPLPALSELRAPEIGLVMLRGRIGGDGAAFNLGEATVTRAAVRLESGVIGHSYLLGRERRRARLAAIVDALGQCEEFGPPLERHLMAPVSARVERERARRVGETNATRVEFFTLVRGEDSP